jgi:hypothetical protein
MSVYQLNAETLALARQVFEEALLALPLKERTSERKSLMARQILTLAASGERDHSRLKRILIESATDPKTEPRGS